MHTLADLALQDAQIFSWRSSGFTVIFVACPKENPQPPFSSLSRSSGTIGQQCFLFLLADRTIPGWLRDEKKGCKIAEFRCDATSDITINLHKRFLRKPSLDGDQDRFWKGNGGFFGCVKIWKSDIFTHQTRNRMSGFSKLCLAYTVCRYPKKIQTFEEVFFFPCNSKQAN